MNDHEVSTGRDDPRLGTGWQSPEQAFDHLRWDDPLKTTVYRLLHSALVICDQAQDPMVRNADCAKAYEIIEQAENICKLHQWPRITKKVHHFSMS